LPGCYAIGIVTPTPDEFIRSGYQARREGRLQEARQIFSDSIASSRNAADPLWLGSSLAGLGQIERDLHNTDAALQHYEEAVEVYRSGAHPLRLAHTLRHLADILRGDGAIERARPLYEEALRIYRDHADTAPLDLANTIRGFALLRGAAGEQEEAKLLWQEARQLYASADVQAGVEESERQIARLTAT